MAYKITIEEHAPVPEGSRLGSWNTVYEQTVDGLDVAELIIAINEPLRERFIEPLWPETDEITDPE